MSLRTTFYITIFIVCDIVVQTLGEYCEYGHKCDEGQYCCSTTCCLKNTFHNAGYGFRWSIWNMWYFWFIVIFILMSCFGGCGYWRRRQLILHQQQSMLQHQQAYNQYINQAACGIPGLNAVNAPGPYGSPHPNAAMGIPNGAPQAAGAFPSPPAYNEVISKPNVYPPSKDELPPYPGEYAPAYGPAYGVMPDNSAPAQPDSSNPVEVPGLPPYSILPPQEGPSSVSSPATMPTSQSNPTQVPPQNNDANTAATSNGALPNNPSVSAAAAANPDVSIDMNTTNVHRL